MPSVVDIAKRALVKVLLSLAYKLRVQSVFKSKKAQNVAAAFARKFRSTCSQVSKRDGAAADN